MNLLIYTSHSRYSNKCVGGSETSLELIARKMAALGHHVCLATLQPPFGKKLIIPDEPVFSKKSIDGLTIFNFDPLSRPREGFSSSDDYKKFVDQQITGFLGSVIKSEKIDIVHSYEINDTFHVLLTRDLFNLNFKIVKRFGGMFWAHAFRSRSLSKEKIEYVLNNVDAVNYLSVQFRDLVLKTAQEHKVNIKPKREMIADIGIDLNLFSYQWRHVPQPLFKIVSVLRFSFYQKRPDLLIKALHAIDKNVVLDLIGEGKDILECKTMRQQLDLNSRIDFSGFLTQQIIAQRLSQAGLFALPTLDEGVSKALLEAMAVGVPCLVSDVTPLNSYIQHNKNGFLVRNTPEDWAQEITHLYKNQENFDEVSLKARELVEKNYNASVNVHIYQKEFNDIINSNGF